MTHGHEARIRGMRRTHFGNAPCWFLAALWASTGCSGTTRSPELEFSIQGQVLDAQARPANGARVGRDFVEWVGGSARINDPAICDAQGEFSTKVGVSHDRSALVVISADEAQGAFRVMDQKDLHSKVTLKMAPMVTVTGRLAAASNLRCVIEIEMQGVVLGRWNGEAGQFTLRLPQGEYTLKARYSLLTKGASQKSRISKGLSVSGDTTEVRLGTIELD
jgi:hypothetical protein